VLVGEILAEQRDRPAIVWSVDRQPRAQQGVAIGAGLRVTVVDRTDELVGDERGVTPGGIGQSVAR